MIAEETLRWGDRINQLEEILRETKIGKHRILKELDEICYLFSQMMNGVVKKPIETPMTRGEFLGESSVGWHNKFKVWLTPTCIGLRYTLNEKKTDRLTPKEILHILRIGEPILSLVEKYTHKDEYVKKVEIFIKHVSRLRYPVDMVRIFPIKPYSVTTNISADRRIIQRDAREYHYDLVSFSSGLISLGSSDGKLLTTTAQNLRYPSFFAIIQPGYPQIKMAAKKYRTVLRNVYKHNAKVIDDLKKDLAPWLVLGAL